MSTRIGRPPVKSENLAKARRLELPVFIVLERILKKRLGKTLLSAVGGPTSDGADKWELSIWRRKWDRYELVYHRDPQVNVSGHPYPDMMIYRGDNPAVAVECKNLTKGTKFTWYTFHRDVIRYFEWLPKDCKRKLVVSHLNTVDSDREKVIEAITDESIDVLELGFHVGPPVPVKLAYARLGKVLPIWLIV